jgi:hypothetical protein
MPDYYDRTGFVKPKDLTRWEGFGDFAIDELILFGPNKLSIDIKNQTGLINLVISESLYQNFVYGEIKFLDFSNLTDRLELNGQDYIQISFTTPGFSGKMVKKKFVVTNFNQLRLAYTGKGKEVTLGFISQDAYSLMQRKVVGSYKGTISDIVSQITKSQFETELVTMKETDNTHSFIIPSWTPYKTLNWLAKRAVSASNREDCSFLFYENLDGNHFTSIHSLTNKPALGNYNYHQPNVSIDISSNKGLYKKFSQIEDLKFNRHFDKVKEIDNGVYASQIVSLDLVTKEYSSQQFDYLEHFDRTDSVETYPLIARESNLNVNKNIQASFNFVGTSSFSQDGIDDNFRYSDFTLKRRSSILRARSSSLSIIVSGDSNRRVGDVVSLDVPKLEPMEDGSLDPKDRMLSGRYLVTSLQHVINKEKGYTTRLELSRDSLPFEFMNAGD